LSDPKKSKDAEDILSEFHDTHIFPESEPQLAAPESEPQLAAPESEPKITQAVDVSQMIVKRMSTVGYVVSDVRILSDSLQSQDGKFRNVSTIEIDIIKN